MKFFQWFRSSFVKKLMLSYLLVLVIPAIIIGAIYLGSMLNDNLRQYDSLMADSVKNMNNNIEKRINNFDLYMSTVSTNYSFSEFFQLSNSRQEYLIIDTLINKIIPSFKYFATTNTDVERIVILHTNQSIPDIYDKVYCRPDDVIGIQKQISDGLFSEYKHDRMYISGPHEMAAYFDAPIASRENVVAFYHPVYSVFRDRTIGYIMIEVKESKMFQDIQPLLSADGSFVDIVGKQGNLIYTSLAGDEKTISRQLSDYRTPQIIEYNRKPYYRFVYDVPSIMAGIVLYIPKQQIDANRAKMFAIFFCSVVGFIFVSAFITYSVSVRLARNLIRLNNNVREIASGNLKVDTRVNTKDEVGKLGENVYYMENQINELLGRVIKLGEMEREAVYMGLQNQLRPHYLCNALDIIRLHAGTHGEKHIANSIEMLISYFRYNMSDMQKFVSIKKELVNAMDYIKLHNLIADTPERCVECIVNIAGPLKDGMESYYTLKFILQPIVENCIRHGFSGSTGYMQIIISLNLYGDMLVIDVEDNGAGMAPDRLAEVKSSLEGKESKVDLQKTARIGLENIRDRLMMNFGDTGSIDIASYAGVGTKVTVSVPLLASPDSMVFHKTGVA